jgi:hypothetical protein
MTLSVTILASRNGYNNKKHVIRIKSANNIIAIEVIKETPLTSSPAGAWWSSEKFLTAMRTDSWAGNSVAGARAEAAMPARATVRESLARRFIIQTDIDIDYNKIFLILYIVTGIRTLQR